MIKGSKKKDGKSMRVQPRVNPKEARAIELLAAMYTDGNVNAWIVLRSTTENDEQFEIALKEYRKQRREILLRKAERMGVAVIAKPLAGQKLRKVSARSH